MHEQENPPHRLDRIVSEGTQRAQPIPPGQTETNQWPVLHYGGVPTVDRAGFWERNGYHMRGDPWQEERYGRPG